MRLHANWQQLQQLTSPSKRVPSQHPLRRSHVHRTAFYGGMSKRARASVNEATTLAKAVHRWQARRARPRCASTPTGISCNSPCRPLHVCRRSTHSRRSHVHCTAFYGGMPKRARASVNEATTLAKAVHRWQARRARPRCASTPTGNSCNSPRRHPNVCRRSIHSGGHTCIEPPSTAACRSVHVHR